MKISTLLKALVICLIPCVLVGQAAGITQGSRPMPLSNFLRMVASNPPASLVLFDTRDKVWEREFERIRREDPYAMLNLNFITLTIDQGAGNELREREGWPGQTPRWAIFSANGRISADGAALPTSTQLADECSRASIIGKAETYRRFLMEYPYHEEARKTLLQEMLTVAGIRTRNALQVPEYRAPRQEGIILLAGGLAGGARADGGDPSAEQIESLPELTPEADERIWRDYCVELQRYLEGALWQTDGGGASLDPSNAAAAWSASLSSLTGALTGNRSGQIVSAWARFSPMTMAAYTKAAITVEAALVRQPSSSTLWGLWETLKKAGAGSSMKELLANLQPSPDVAPADWPPASVRASYLRLCRETGDWKAIQDLVEPAWNSLASMGQELRIISNRNTQGAPGPNALAISLFNQGFWVSSGEAYLEALLNQQRLSDAEDMMKTWASGSGWPGAFSAAAAIAERLGYESVGKSWRAMGEK